jgi:hypothetical protein
MRCQVLLLDVARFKYPPHWVPLPLLYESMQAVDAATGRCRGYALMSRSEVATSLLLTVSRSKLDKVVPFSVMSSSRCPRPSLCRFRGISWHTAWLPAPKSRRLLRWALIPLQLKMLCRAPWRRCLRSWGQLWSRLQTPHPQMPLLQPPTAAALRKAHPRAMPCAAGRRRRLRCSVTITLLPFTLCDTQWRVCPCLP